VIVISKAAVGANLANAIQALTDTIVVHEKSP